MKVILYMAITPNGFIARYDDSTPWSDEEWESYSGIVKRAGNIIIGRKTYELMKKDNSFDLIGNPTIVVLSTSQPDKEAKDTVYFADKPSKALDILSEKRFEEVLVTGGGKLNSSFLKENLVDEIYLDVEPIIFGDGINLFYPDEFEYQLQLLETKKLNDNTIQLHYSVVK